MTHAVEIENARVSFGDVHAVNGVSLSVAPGEVHVLLGRSGSGKTTLLRAIAGFEPLTEGVVRVADRIVDNANRTGWVPPEQRNIGFVFQDYALFTHLDAIANVGFGITGDRKQKRAKALQWLGRVELDSYVSRKPGQLSGGEQQRVALARALAQEPGLVLLDEPFSNLDPHLRRQVRNDTLDLLRESGATAIFVTHDIEEAFALGDRLTVLDHGNIEQTGAPEDLYHRPETEAVARLAGPVALVSIDSWDDGVATTSFGRVDSNEGKTLVVRPEQWTLSPGGEGTITRRRFQGSGYEFDVDLGDTTHVVRSQVSYDVGAAVSLQLSGAGWALT